jgi:predicted CXXCH cytochrome family protein
VAAQAGTSYHAIRDHDGVNVRCVRCHRSHTTDSDARNRFISKAIVLPICRECHKAM